jgi:hypothetical protein
MRILRRFLIRLAASVTRRDDERLTEEIDGRLSWDRPLQAKNHSEGNAWRLDCAF